MALNRVTPRIIGDSSYLGSLGYIKWQCDTLTDFQKWVDIVSENNSTVVFRGQRKNWPLLPSICRGEFKNGTLLNLEKKLLDTFKNEAKDCLHLQPETDWDWLVVGQHHGLPTRILDWSEDPLVALWFALEKHEKEGSEPEVWALRVSKDNIIKSLDKARPFYGNRTKLFHTSFKIPRINNQKGCFILFKYIEKIESGFVRLERNKRLRGKIEKIVISNRVAPDLFDQLHNMGYHKDSLFPDIDKVAESIRQRILNNG